MEEKKHLDLQIEKFKGLIQKYEQLNKWRFAKTYAKTLPHEYLLIYDIDYSDRDIFMEFAKFITKYGYTLKFGNSEFTYFNIEGFKYWITIGKNLNTVILINRDRLKNAKSYWKEKYKGIYY